MLYLSVEVRKILMNLQEELVKEASKFMFLMLACLRGKGFC